VNVRTAKTVFLAVVLENSPIGPSEFELIKKAVVVLLCEVVLEK
jgi:hypothetical protein